MRWPDGVSLGELAGGITLAEGGQFSLPAVLLLVALVGVGAWLLGQRRRGAERLPSLGEGPRGGPARPAGEALGPGGEPAVAARAATVGRHLSSAFLEWLADEDRQEPLWPAFDQLLRELLSEHLQAQRVRGYHVRGDGAARGDRQADGPPLPADGVGAVLIPLSQTAMSDSDGPPGPSARAGLLGHVATTGTEFAGDDPRHGPLVAQLAAQSEEGWAWVWPVRVGGGTVGLVAVGHLRPSVVLTPALRQTVGPLVTLFWQHVAALEQLRVVQRTDQVSGVLTRGDFLARAEPALRDAYRNFEPAVVAVLAIEGLRRLDDGGCWRERDQLVQRLGHVLTWRVRSDDLVGRFADDRFVLFLRRLDSGLGRLIAEKILASASASVAELDGVRGRVRLRLGLAGSGLGQPSLHELLTGALEAVERARKNGAPLETDLRPGPTPGGPAPA